MLFDGTGTPAFRKSNAKVSTGADTLAAAPLLAPCNALTSELT
jgi:hypothetical protein